jgi:hypothetical protein
MTDLTVCCFLWDDPHRQRSYRFDESHVRILKSMVSRHLHLPHEFCCVTDRSEIGEGIRVIPLDDRTHVPSTCGRKLTIWAPDAAERIGKRILSLDLDMVIVDDITPLIDRPEDVVMFLNPNFVEGGRRAFYQGSIQLMTAGSRPQVWTEFFSPSMPLRINSRFGGFEQAWLSETLPWDEAHWDHRDGIFGAGRIGDWSTTNVSDNLPEGARIVVFPGNRIPSQPHVMQKFPWIEEHIA